MTHLVACRRNASPAWKGWTTHGMIGFDRDRAVAALGIPPDFSVDAVYTIGKLGDSGDLPEGLRVRERPPDASH